MQKINFYSGPAILPAEVLEQAAEAVRNFKNTGLSILEVSHRSKEFVEVMEQSRALVRELLKLDADREVLFLHGGGSAQFYTVPYNLLNAGETASYFDTGNWANSALSEARNFGSVHVAASSVAENYSFIPKRFSIPADSKYLHITTNNTVNGTQFHFGNKKPKEFFGIECPLVADMSSDIFSRQLDFNQFDLIYAAAQKNMGPAGTTLVVVNKNILGTVSRNIPELVDYRVQIKNDSMRNTPSVFAVYVSCLTLHWIQKMGIEELEKRNERKARKLYDALDASALFAGTAAKEDRSLMNVCFVLKDKTLESKFLEYAEAQGIVGIQGYRTVGGFRASIYNAMPESGVDALVQVLHEFERTRG